jgi:hypothetical protein
LSLTLPVGAPKPTLPAGDRLTAQVTLKDDRTLAIPIVVEAARPSVALIAEADVPSEAMPKTQFSIKLAGQNDLPITDALMFSVRSAQPFPRKGEIEIAVPTTPSTPHSASPIPMLRSSSRTRRPSWRFSNR